MIKKLKSSAGESIAEVLVACLIMALGLLMLASMITTSKNLITRTEQRFSAHYQRVNGLEAAGELAQNAGMTASGIKIGTDTADFPIEAIQPGNADG